MGKNTLGMPSTGFRKAPKEVVLLFPTLVWTRSGSKGKISACYYRHP